MESSECVDVEAINNTCSICCDTLKTRITLTCKHTFCYLCIKTFIGTCIENNEDHTPCPICREPIPNSLFENASIDVENAEECVSEYAWMYQGRNGGWWYFQANHNVQIEEGYAKFNDYAEELKKRDDGIAPGDINDEVIHDEFSSVEIEVCAKPYIINFHSMEQHPKNTYGGYRKIKRVDKHDLSNAKGVAGLRYIMK
jgi:E3 ubiquitin-protein ligase RNF146